MICVLRGLPVLVACLPLLGFTGCTDGKIGRVTGKVTLDGNPLSNALVTFNPITPGGESGAICNENGEYELIYTREIKGAEVGEHLVRITTARDRDPDADPPTKSSPEILPPKYHVKSELTATVKPGKNQIHFTLESK
jgi:hypothetical protein